MARSYGPNTRLIEGFLARLADLAVGDFRSVVRRWRDGLARADAWYAAEDAVGDAIASSRRDGEMWSLQDRLYAIFRDAPWYTAPPPVGSAAPAEAASQYLATTAAVALLVADLLPAAHLNVLYAPFAEAIPLADLALGAASARGRSPDGSDAGTRH